MEAETGLEVVGRDTATPARSGPRQRVRWTRALTGMFLDHLAATGDITGAARSIAIHPSQAYYRLRTNDAFAAAWAAAIDAGYQTVETRLIGHVLSGGNPDVTMGTGTGGGRFDWEYALRLLSLRERRAGGKTKQGGPTRQLATRQETDALILRKLAAIAARKASPAVDAVIGVVGDTEGADGA